MRRLGLPMLLLALAGAPSLSGCLAVGYSSGGGWFVWPGGVGLLVILLVLWFALRGRR